LPEYIKKVPKYMQPTFTKPLRILYGCIPKYYDENLWEKVIDESPLIKIINLNKFDWKGLIDILNIHIYDKMKQDDRFIINDKIIYDKMKLPEIPEDMILCENCGNVWDGFAQCMCYYSD